MSLHRRGRDAAIKAAVVAVVVLALYVLGVL